jgi:hypothetical protein
MERDPVEAVAQGHRERAARGAVAVVAGLVVRLPGRGPREGHCSPSGHILRLCPVWGEGGGGRESSGGGEEIAAMRVLLKASFDTERSSDILRTGKLPQMMQELMERTHPEASYFTVDQGRRTMYLFFDMTDSSDMPSIADPLFGEMGASIDYTPVMNLDDLQKGLAKLS